LDLIGLADISLTEAERYIAHQQYFARAGSGVVAHQRSPDPHAVVAHTVHQLARQSDHFTRPSAAPTVFATIELPGITWVLALWVMIEFLGSDWRASSRQ